MEPLPTRAELDALNEDARAHQEPQYGYCAECAGEGEITVYPDLGPSPGEYEKPCPTCRGLGIATLAANKRYRQRTVRH